MRARVTQEQIEKAKWRTEDGVKLNVVNMADSHLLNCIHLMERRRLEQLEEIARRYGHLPFHDPNVYPNLISYYKEFSIRYSVMVAEAEKRKLIFRANTEDCIQFTPEELELWADDRCKPLYQEINRFREMFDSQNEQVESLCHERDVLKFDLEQTTEQLELLKFTVMTSFKESKNVKSKTSRPKVQNTQGRKKASRKRK